MFMKILYHISRYVWIILYSVVSKVEINIINIDTDKAPLQLLKLTGRFKAAIFLFPFLGISFF